MLSAIAAVVAATVDDSCGPREELDDTVRRQHRRGCQPTSTVGAANAARQCRHLTTIRPDQVAGHRWNHHHRYNCRLHRRHRQPFSAWSLTATGSGNTSSKSTGSRRRPSSRRPLDGGVEGSSMYVRSTDTAAAVATTTANDRTDDRRRLWRNTNANTWIAADDDNWTAVPGGHTRSLATHTLTSNHTHTHTHTHTQPTHLHTQTHTHTLTYTHATCPHRIPYTPSHHSCSCTIHT